LNEAAPDAWVELNPADADRHGIAEGDVVRVESPRGAIEVRARVGHVMAGAVFAPFHYGTWDLSDVEADPAPRQANELTMTVWDPVSKQPYFKTSACRIAKVRDGDGPSPAPTTAASAPTSRTVPPTQGGAATTSERVATPRYPNDQAQGAAASAPTQTIAGSS